MILGQSTLKNVRFVILNFVFFLMLVPTALSHIKITEIMYNPVGLDIYGEYFELCNFANKTINLTNYTLLGVSTDLSNIIVSPKQCIVFANTKDKTGPDNDFFDLYNISLAYYNLTFEFTGYLNNDNDSLSLIDANGFVIDNFTYNATLANGNGFSLNKYDNFVLEQEPSPFYYDLDLCFNLSNTTPQAINVTNISNLSNITNLTENILNITQGNLSENINDTLINESLENQTSETINQTNNELNESYQSNLFIELISIENNTVYYRILSNCSYTYWIEDLYNNIIKQPLNSSSSSKKQFTPKYDLVFFIKARNSCNLKNASKLVILNNSLTQKSTSDFDYLSRYKKVRLEIDADFVQKTDFTIYCYLNDGEQIFYFHQDSIKPLIDSDFKIEFFVPENLFEQGENEIQCKIELYNNTQLFKEKFTYDKPQSNAKTIAVSSIKNKAAVEIQSFYTLDKYFKDKNHFFVNLKQNSLLEEPLLLEVYELKGNLSLTMDTLNSSKQNFYLNLDKENTTLFALIRNNDSIIAKRFLDVDLVKRSLAIEKEISDDSSNNDTFVDVRNDSAQELESFAESLKEKSYNALNNITLTNQLLNATKNSDEITSFFSLENNSTDKLSLKQFIVPFAVFLSCLVTLILFRIFLRKK